MALTPEEEAVLRAVAKRNNQSLSHIRKTWVLDPFIFGINYLPATLSAISTGQFLVQNDSAFAICKTTCVVTDTSDAAVANLIPFGNSATSLLPFLVTITDSGSGRNLSDIAVPIDSWFGTAQRPYIWSYPKVLDPQSQLTVTVQNLSATDRRVRLAFHGYKIFKDIQGFLAQMK